MSERGSRIVITGATGAVGPTLVRFLAAQPDVSVVALARHAPPPGVLPDDTRFVAAPLDDERTMAEVRDADLVCHLAARLHVNDPGADLRADYERINVEATRRLVDAARPSARFLFFSSIDVYGPTPEGAIADEATSPQPRSLYGETKLRAETFALAHPGGRVLRLAAVYGPRVKANYARLVSAIAKGRYVQIGHGRNRRTLVFDGDVARAAWTIATTPVLPSRLYNVTDGGVHSVNAIVAAIALAVRRKQPGVSLPAGPVRFAAAALDALARVVGRRAPITPQMIDKLQENVAVSGARLMRELGFEPCWDLQTGWREVVSARPDTNDTA